MYGTTLLPIMRNYIIRVLHGRFLGVSIVLLLSAFGRSVHIFDGLLRVLAILLVSHQVDTFTKTSFCESFPMKSNSLIA